MRFAYLVMGSAYDSRLDRAQIGDGAMRLVGVCSIEDACIVAEELRADGIDCIELCGAFGENGAKRVIEATQNQIPIGYITHLPEQDEIYRTAFAKR